VVQLEILLGKMAGHQQVARRFPFMVGRAPNAGLKLEDPGVWDEHFTIHLGPDAQFEMHSRPGASSYVNGNPLQTRMPRNGDLIKIGAVEMRFGLSPTRQRSFVARELFVWVGLTVISLGQVALIYWLLQ
jgi:hypothetical protein